MPYYVLLGTIYIKKKMVVQEKRKLRVVPPYPRFFLHIQNPKEEKSIHFQQQNQLCVQMWGKLP